MKQFYCNIFHSAFRYVPRLAWLTAFFAIFIGVEGYAQPACVNGSGCCGTPVEVGIPDGDFEDPTLPTPPPVIATYFGGQTFGAWTVVSGSIDLLASAAYGGSNLTQIIDLNGFTSGTITNTLNNLQPGACYVIVLEYAKNPGTAAANCRALVAGGAWLDVTWTSTNNASAGWEQKCLSFTAQASSAELRLIGSSNVAVAGMLLDNITMWEIPNQPPPPPGAISGASPVCAGASETYSVSPVAGANAYNWTITPSSAGTISGGSNNTITINWAANATGTASVCVGTANACSANPNLSCLNVSLLPIPTATLTGLQTQICGPGGSAQLNLAFTGQGPWTFVHNINNVPQAPITTFDNPYVLTVTQPGLYTLGSVEGPPPACPYNLTGSVSVTQVNINLSATVQAATCGQSNGAINLTVSGNGTPPYTYSWSNGSTTKNLTGIPGGVYTLVVTDLKNCSSQLTVNVLDNIVPIDIAAVLAPNTNCNGNNTGAINLSVSPTGNYTYAWSNGKTTQNLSNLTSDVYTVTVTSGITCSNTAEFTVPDLPNAPDLFASQTSSSCDLPNGSINLAVNGGISPYTYIWSNGLSTQSLVNVLPGTYTVTVTGANNCTRTETVELGNNNPPFDVSVVPSPNTSCILANGSIDLSVSPIGPYTYIWSTGAMTQDLNNLPAAEYTVTVSAGGSCTETLAITIDETAVLPILSPMVTPETCKLGNGAINLSVSGGIAPFVFNWSNGKTTQNISDLAAGNYRVTVTSALGCSTVSDFQVPANNLNFVISGTVSDNTSCAVPNGVIQTTVAPAAFPYSFLWSNGYTVQNINALAAGMYTVTATLGTCTATANFSVLNAQLAPTAMGTGNSALCGLSNGSAEVSVSGGTAPYSYAWNNGQSSQTALNLGPGVYNVTVQDGNGCTAVAITQVGNNAPVITINASVLPNTACVNPNGAVDINVTPTDVYQFSWSNNAVSEDISGLAAGIYTVTVSAVGNCSASASFQVTNNILNPAINAQITPATCGNANGAIDLQITAVTGPYSFIWSNGATSEDLSNVLSGIYAVTVTSMDGCTQDTIFTVVNNADSFSLSGFAAPITRCDAANSAIDLTITPPGVYTIIWSNGATTEDLVGPNPGTYTVTVSKTGSCLASASFTVFDERTYPDIQALISADICSQAKGAIDLSVTGGVLPYVFSWSTASNSEDLSNIASGVYSVTVTGANACLSQIKLNVPDSIFTPILSGSTTPNTSCLLNNGAVNLSVTPIDAYNFAWSNGETTQQISQLAGGNYTVTVTKGACTASAVYTVANGVNLPVLSAQTTDVQCFGDKTGGIDVSVSGGAAPFQYMWTPVVPGNLQDLNQLGAGSYALVLKDAAGCTASANYTIHQPTSAVQLNCVGTFPVSAPNLTDGTASVSISGGVAPYQINWTGGAGQANLSAGNFTLPNLAVGNYGVTVTDANGCTSNCSFDINLKKCNTSLGLLSTTALSTCGSGCITASYDDTGQFLEPEDALQFILHTGSGAQIIDEIGRSNQPVFCFDPQKMVYGATYYIAAVAGNKLPNGQVDLTDFCTKVAPGPPIQFFPKPVASIGNPAKITCLTPQITLEGQSDLPGCTFSWSTLDGNIVGGGKQPFIQVDAGGVYTLVIDLNGCLDTVSVTVIDLRNHPVAAIQASPNTVFDCKISQITLSGNVSGSTNAQIVWFFNENVFSNGAIVPIQQPGNYVFIIQDTVSFCRDTAVVQIDQNLAYPPLNSIPPGILNCLNPILTLNGSSPLAGIQFQWRKLNGSDTITVSNASITQISTPGTYFLEGFDPANGCRNTLTELVTANFEHPMADAGSGFSLNCFGQTAFLDGSASSGAPDLNFAWTSASGSILDGAETSGPRIGSPGTYTLMVENPLNGCRDTAEVLISPRDLKPFVTVKQAACYGDKGFFQIDSVAGGKPPVQFSLDNGLTYNTQRIYGNLNKGVYKLRIKDDLGCSAEEEITLLEPDPLVLTLIPAATVKLGDSLQLNATVNVPPA
ncbi:MAG: DUF642 domain-containing protein, partial [Bacteroidetes bacterium]|nr:DUF642 domain-containing protein [Bacteroidota bacterium]